MKQIIFLALILGLGVASAQPSESIRLRYPLDAPPNVTATFGAFRLRHHHAGLDLYTDDQESVPVVAAADGVVYKLRRNQVGYGRSLYVRHANGWVTVYGHLSAFGPKLVDLEREAEVQAEGYFVERGIHVSVRAGEVLGYIGTSGTDLIHLHFELRKGGQPVNPLRHGLTLPDTKAPEIRRLKAFPRDAAAHVSHAQDEVVLPFKAGKLEAPLEIFGDVGLLVEVADRIDGSSRDLTPYTVELRIDGVRRHLVRYEAVSYGDVAQTELDFDPQTHADKSAEYNKLYREGPPVRVHEPGRRDLKDLKPGKHRALIEATDAAGHRVQAQFELVVTPLKPPCAFKRGERASQESPAPTTRLLRESTLIVPFPNACPGEVVGEATIDGKPVKAKALAWTRLNGQPALAVDVPPDKATRVQVSAGGARHTVELAGLVSGKKTRLGPVALDMGKDALFFPYPTDLVIGPKPKSDGLIPLSPVYRMANGWRPTKGPSRVSVPRPEGDTTGMGLYLSERGHFWHVGGPSGSDRVGGWLVHLGDYVVMRDTKRPEIGAPQVGSHPAGPRLEVKVKDQGSGVSKASLELDGVPINAEWQRSYGRLLYLPLFRVTPGRHTVTVRAKDRVGLTAVREETITWPAHNAPERRVFETRVKGKQEKKSKRKKKGRRSKKAKRPR